MEAFMKQVREAFARLVESYGDRGPKAVLVLNQDRKDGRWTYKVEDRGVTVFETETPIFLQVPTTSEEAAVFLESQYRPLKYIGGDGVEYEATGIVAEAIRKAKTLHETDRGRIRKDGSAGRATDDRAQAFAFGIDPDEKPVVLKAEEFAGMSPEEILRKVAAMTGQKVQVI